MSWYKIVDDGVMINVKASPRSSRSGVDFGSEDALKVRLKSAPVDGKANKELVSVLSEVFDIPKSRVLFMSGETGKTKRLLLQGIDQFEFLRKI